MFSILNSSSYLNNPCDINAGNASREPACCKSVWLLKLMGQLVPVRIANTLPTTLLHALPIPWLLSMALRWLLVVVSGCSVVLARIIMRPSCIAFFTVFIFKLRLRQIELTSSPDLR